MDAAVVSSSVVGTVPALTGAVGVEVLVGVAPGVAGAVRVDAGLGAISIKFLTVG